MSDEIIKCTVVNHIGLHLDVELVIDGTEVIISIGDETFSYEDLIEHQPMGVWICLPDETIKENLDIIEAAGFKLMPPFNVTDLPLNIKPDYKWAGVT